MRVKQVQNNNYTINRDLLYKQNSNRQKEQNILNITYLFLKACILLLSLVSLIKIGYVSKIRITRLKEIKNSYLYEKLRFNDLSSRFDNLISFEGEQRFMKDQEQMISRDIIRVIWR